MPDPVAKSEPSLTPTCDKCGIEITTGVQAMLCPHADECELWPTDSDIETERFAWRMWKGYAHQAFAQERARAEVAEARVDALMLEYCPNEMTDGQKARWANHQRMSSAGAGIREAVLAGDTFPSVEQCNAAHPAPLTNDRVPDKAGIEAFGRWYESQTAYWHSGHFSEREIALAAWCEANRRAAAPSGWISVEERLPEKGQRVYVESATHGFWNAECYSGDGGYEHGFYSPKATHWMPLPAPPGEQSAKEGR